MRGEALVKWMPRHLRGLVAQEWLAFRPVIVGIWVAWLVGLPVLQLFNHPAWIFALGLIYALVLAAAVGGRDVFEGCEESAFALPPTRSERFLVRLALVGGNLALLLTTGLVAIALDLPQRLWGLVVETGFTAPFPPAAEVHGASWYALAATAPPALFAAGFVLAALARSRGGVVGAAIVSVLLIGVVAGLGLLVEYAVWGYLHAGLAAGLLGTTCLGLLWFGHARYRRKEGINRPVPPSGRSWWWLWLLLGVVVLLLLYLVLVFGR